MLSVRDNVRGMTALRQGRGASTESTPKEEVCEL